MENITESEYRVLRVILDGTFQAGIYPAGWPLIASLIKKKMITLQWKAGHARVTMTADGYELATRPLETFVRDRFGVGIIG